MTTGEINLAASGDSVRPANEMRARIAAHDWSSTAVGPANQWPKTLQTAVSICLGSRYPIVLWWGREALTMFYNDGYIPMLGAAKHPQWLGRSGREAWSEIWDVIRPMFDQVFETGEATWSEDLLLVMDRHVAREETYFTFSYSPIPDDTGAVGGIFCAVSETTGRVIGERRLRTLRDLGRAASETKTVEAACESAARALEANAADVPFAMIYLADDAGEFAHLTATVGINRESAAAPEIIDLSRASSTGGSLESWPVGRALRTQTAELLTDLRPRFDNLPSGPWPEPTEKALVIPIHSAGQLRPVGCLVAGLSPCRVVDADYRTFFDLIAGRIGTAIGNALAYETERKRAETLAELDRAKTAFFSNVSHEFRTPLTLILGPAEQALAEDLAHDQRERVELIHRNGLRLERLVNTLLDFSRIEAGRVDATFEATDLGAYTRELASGFRSAIHRAGLTLVLQSPPRSAPVYVDRDMWEKIVLNLLSNALKHTFEGEIAVAVSFDARNATLTVRDTGVGIPADQLPRVFERFHRVPNARSRTHEGTGIGLALVKELAKIHGGEVGVTSEEWRGSTFTVSIPLGVAHLPADRVGARRTLLSTAVGAAPYVQEALRWLSEPVSRDVADTTDASDAGPNVEPTRGARILVADDNLDMREYVARILRARGWVVETAADGESALAAVRDRAPDLVLSDVMMPGVDGFGVLRALRSDAATRDTPIILLSARAGEESRIEGLDAGADDYLVKPFSARELTARVAGALRLARLRRETDAALREKTREAEAANRAKSEFLAAMSHELRTPLNAIGGHAELLKLGLYGRLTSEQLDAIERIERSERHLLALINDILNFAKLEAGRVVYHLENLAIADVVAEAIGMIEMQLHAKGLRCTTRVSDAVVRADRERLTQVLINLMSNAIKFTGTGGHVTVETIRRVDDDSPLSVHLRVADTGIGIPREKQESIFDPFVQVHRRLTQNTEGTGLGLAISRDLARGMGGDLRVRSTEGNGSAFTLTLPRVEAAIGTRPAIGHPRYVPAEQPQLGEASS
jgi:signal transduction histidine kinase